MLQSLPRRGCLNLLTRPAVIVTVNGQNSAEQHSTAPPHRKSRQASSTLAHRLLHANHILPIWAVHISLGIHRALNHFTIPLSSTSLAQTLLRGPLSSSSIHSILLFRLLRSIDRVCAFKPDSAFSHLPPSAASTPSFDISHRHTRSAIPQPPHADRPLDC